MEAYVDDMLVKNTTFKQHLKDLEKVFVVLSKCEIKLNPSKYVFAIREGKFLGFLVKRKEIEPNPEKTQAILDMTPP
jgi:hypothetical protein